jgi:ABC-type uncharacterized transport system substrate-binding protein
LESKTVHEPLANVQNIFLITIPSPNSVNIVSNLVKEAKKNGIKYIVKLSIMMLMLNLGMQWENYADKKKRL